MKCKNCKHKIEYAHQYGYQHFRKLDKKCDCKWGYGCSRHYYQDCDCGCDKPEPKEIKEAKNDE